MVSTNASVRGGSAAAVAAKDAVSAGRKLPSVISYTRTPKPFPSDGAERVRGATAASARALARRWPR